MLNILSANLEIKGRRLLNDISISVKPGLLSVVLGPNGAGKSTLLKVLSGEWQPDSGRVFLEDKLLRDIPDEERAKKLAVLPQQSSLSFPFKVEDVVALGRLPHAEGSIKDGQIIHECLEAADALFLAGRIYTSLSGGERQRVHLARVLAQIWDRNEKQKYLLLDEPTAALDIAHQHLMMQASVAMARRGLGVLVVLHDLNLASQYADYIVMLKQGKVAHEGPVSAALCEQSIQDVFNVSVTTGVHPKTGRKLLFY